MTYHLEPDDDGHWYIVPTNKDVEWDRWIESGSWEVPEWAIPVNGHPNLVSFDDFEVQ